MKNRYRLICYAHRGGIYCLNNNQTGQSESLEINHKFRALEPWQRITNGNAF